ncbi:helix-turn-helix domain-containing protein, partial [Klebsiella pneumoniae]|uniref:helix-turn-helix domain-containing protein n=1 Tax=Klebsiella pneumoniae TaxID=573 RepID=UPI0030271B74
VSRLGFALAFRWSRCHSEPQSKFHLSVFAQLLNLTVGYVSQLERGAKRPTGATLALLNVIQRKGIEVVL